MDNLKTKDKKKKDKKKSKPQLYRKVVITGEVFIPTNMWSIKLGDTKDD